MSDPKRHHFVPAAYLEKFTGSDGFLHVYDKKLNQYRRQRPYQVMVRNKYYNQPWAPDGFDANQLEKSIGANLEPNGMAALEKLVDSPESIDAEDTASILVYLEFQRVRVPRQAEMAKGLYGRVLMAELMKTREGRKAISQGHIKINDSVRFDFMKAVTGKLHPYFSRMQWEIVTAEGGASFATSDSPVSFLCDSIMPPIEPVLGFVGTSVIFPLNSSKMLIMRHPEYVPDSGMNPRERVAPDEKKESQIEIVRNEPWSEAVVMAMNWFMLQLSDRCIAAHTKELLEKTEARNHE